jgi:hypothetical protein
MKRVEPDTVGEFGRVGGVPDVQIGAFAHSDPTAVRLP